MKNTTWGSFATVNMGLFGALSDAGPDAWGKRVILSLHKTKPKNALEYLLAGSSMGAGALVFSLSSSASKSKRSRNNLGELPCRVSTTSVKNTPIGDIFLAERFDMTKRFPHCHFLSANSIFNTAKVSSESLKLNYSYGYLAEFIMKYGADPLDAHELFYRMVFNVFIGNTDDHARNHACIYDLETREWRLSPAFDVLPINNSGLHGIGVGEQGRFGNIDNLLSQSVRFGLKQVNAKRIIEDVRALVDTWQRYFSELGVGDADIERLKGVVPKVE